MSATLRRAKERAGIVIPGRGFHLVRHALATRLVAGNVDIKTVAAILGHSTPRMFSSGTAMNQRHANRRRSPPIRVPLRTFGHSWLGRAEGVDANLRKD
jgi:integrase